jgi:hypothetical protein
LRSAGAREYPSVLPLALSPASAGLFSGVKWLS